MKKDTLLIFDFGGQYCHLIARRVRDNSVYSEIVPCDTPAKKIEEMGSEFNIKGIILSGGPSSIYEKDSPKMDKGILDLGIPILGICYGHQLLANYTGGDVKQAKKKEFGSSVATIDNSDKIFKGLGHGVGMVLNPASTDNAKVSFDKSSPTPDAMRDVAHMVGITDEQIQELHNHGLTIADMALTHGLK